MLTIQEALNNFGEKKIKDVIQKLDSNNKTTTGKLNQSLNYKLESNPESLQFIMSFYAEHYLINVTYGRKPGTYPNIDNLREWCISRGIPLTSLYPIAKKIFEKGIPADSSLIDALSQESFADFGGVLKGEAVKELQDQLNKIITEFKKYN